MTDRLYTREEMVEAFRTGAIWISAEMSSDLVDTIHQAAIQHVDGLQAMRGTAQDARGKSQIPGMVSEDALALLVAYKADLEEFKLKTKEREKALVRVVGRMFLEAMMRFQFSAESVRADAMTDEERAEEAARALRRNEDAFVARMDWMTHELNTYFPELTENE